MVEKQYGIYLVKEEYAPDGRYLGFRCSVVEAQGQQGFVAKTDIQIKPDANKQLDEDEDLKI